VSAPKTSRIQLRLKETLKREILSFAKRHNTTVSQIVTAYFTAVLAEERESRRKSSQVDAEQI